MSYEAINWAYVQDLKIGPKFVLVTLANYADERGECYPTCGQIGAKTGLKERAVQGHLKSLSEGGYFTRKRTRNGDGTLGRYRFKLALKSQPPAKSASGKKVQKPPAESAGHNPHINPQYTHTSMTRAWTPNAKSEALLEELNFTDDERTDLLEDFKDFWIGEAKTKRGKKSDDGWNRTFRRNAKTTAIKFRTEYQGKSTRQARPQATKQSKISEGVAAAREQFRAMGIE